MRVLPILMVWQVGATSAELGAKLAIAWLLRIGEIAVFEFWRRA